MDRHHHHDRIATELGLKPHQVKATATLLKEGATVPFIARYRKERTGALDEIQIATIRDRLEQLAELEKRRQSILASLHERQLLTDELRHKITQAAYLRELEDLFQPFRQKRRTRATTAREQGLEPLAKLLMKQQDINSLRAAKAFLDPAQGVNDVQTALQGACDIIAEDISNHAAARRELRHLFKTKAILISRVQKGKERGGERFRDYFEWEEPASHAPSHRILAIFRGEQEKILTVRIRPPEEEAISMLDRLFVHTHGETAQIIRDTIKDAYRRLLRPSLEHETRQELKQRADAQAIHIFANNLRELLMAPPLGQKRVMGVDPGFRTGCKLVCLDNQGKLLHHTVVYPHSHREAEAAKTVEQLCERYAIEAIAIGNGTAGRETERFFRTLNLSPNLQIVMVNESGASIYSASESAREEFPDHDLTVRGAVSIARRLMDPLAELVKIDPKSIGVGQYQHDVDQKALHRSLDDTVISCVNRVGVDVNTASKELLGYVSGLNRALAGYIVTYRNEHGPFRS
ncbi:MAG: RNA-binding transcriptional accessory protein, partial [Lentisphaerae bacterium]